ncbi:MAG: DUF59 domain-containing protein, partial [Rhodothermales bacterium]|nr:DUF59 domain-containing protein [Rhodothermales bacterium]
MTVSPEAVLDALRNVVDPAINKDIVRMNMVRRLAVDESGISFTVMLRDPTSPFADQVSWLCESAIAEAGIDGGRI